MNQVGQNDSSKSPDLTVNFRTTKNDEKTLKILKMLQIASKKENGSNEPLRHKIFTENGAPYLNVSTNLYDRPLKFLIDTGASISLISSDALHKETSKIDYVVNLYGIMGKDVSVKTEGMVNGILSFDGHFLGTTLHVVDKRFAGPADGYIGFDFLSPYRVVIDLNEMLMCINPKHIIKIGDISENEAKEFENLMKFGKKEQKSPTNFLYQLAENYEFETEKFE